MIVTVCQLRVEQAAGPLEDWAALVKHARAQHSDLVLLPEMPFYPWPFGAPRFDAVTWRALEEAHQSWLPRLSDLAPAVVAGSRPVTRRGRRYNEGFLWSDAGGYRAVHDKVFLPDEPGFWEASWYERGEDDFAAAPLRPDARDEGCAGFLICTELWSMEKARAYGQAGAQLVLTPRATEQRTVDKWLAAGRVAAVIAGAFSLSSNHYHERGEAARLGGQGWVVDPDGEVLALTTPARPFASVDIDLERAVAARKSYPRYVWS
jgi:N-carbamoylputrescine amidase